MWAVVGQFSKIANNLHPLVNLPAEMTAMTPYSVILMAIGASASFVVASLVLLDMCLAQRRRTRGCVINTQPLVQGTCGTTVIINNATARLRF